MEKLVNNEITKYYEKHRYCPKCGSPFVEYTTAGWVDIDRNKARCSCGWTGIVDDLLAEFIY